MKKLEKVIIRIYVDDYADFGGYGEVKPYTNNKRDLYLDSILKELEEKFIDSKKSIKEDCEYRNKLSLENEVYMYTSRDLYYENCDEIEYLWDRIDNELSYIKDILWGDIYNAVFIPARNKGVQGTMADAYKLMKMCERY